MLLLPYKFKNIFKRRIFSKPRQLKSLGPVSTAISHVLPYVPVSSPDCDISLYCRFYFFSKFFSRFFLLSYRVTCFPCFKLFTKKPICNICLIPPSEATLANTTRLPVSDAIKFNMADRVHRLSLAASAMQIMRHVRGQVCVVSVVSH